MKVRKEGKEIMGDLGAEQILKITSYLELFGSTKAEQKKNFKNLCKTWHPDVNNSKEAKEVFEHIMFLWNNIGNSIVTDGSKVINITFEKENGKRVIIDNPISFDTALGKVYHTTTKVILVFEECRKKFYDNYLKQVNSLKYENSKMEQEFKRYFPEIKDTFKTKEGRYVIVINKTSEVKSLKLIVEEYVQKGEKVPQEHLNWIFNRLYNLACYMNWAGIVFNGLALENIWVSPEMHTVLLLDGWEYTVSKGENLIGLPLDVYNNVPNKVKTNKAADTLIDILSIRGLGCKLTNKGNDDILEFFESHVSEHATLVEDWDTYYETMRKHFPKKFYIWEDVPYKKN